ncbi:HAD-IIA family hydrolase [uncultured Bifidobacterium sp.]|uniref:HAD-IIA family hydrolase n=1 Tax=uncultured Bifidobacterium sp. TaxID=165187 RepID=UPI00262E7EAB|nr:HAD-IIA family hydrolase [uncultured Bifidobacterium sp.]
MTGSLKGSDGPLLDRYSLALVDLDGVVYRGGEAVDHAVESIDAARSAGMSVVYTTNNSSRYPRVVAEQLRGYGLDAADGDVITSSMVAARMVARELEPQSPVLVIGADHLRDEVAGQGLVVVNDARDHPVAVIQGWYPTLSWHELAEASYAIESGARYFVTNRDLTIPREQGIAPGCGSLIAAVIAATGMEPESSAGKPESAMYDEARVLAAHDGQTPVGRDLCLAVGDRLDTDIEAGNRGGYDSLVVLTGVADARALMCAPRHLRPTFVSRDLRGLAQTHPRPTRRSLARWSCGDAVTRLQDGDLEVAGGTGIDRLRAACCAAWDLMDNADGLEGARLPDITVEDV